MDSAIDPPCVVHQTPLRLPYTLHIARPPTSRLQLIVQSVGLINVSCHDEPDIANYW